MSKRKLLPGGYDESSDDILDLGESPKRLAKRLPPVRYAPPRLTAALKSGTGVFQLPGATGGVSLPPSRHVSLSSSSSRRPTPAIEIGEDHPIGSNVGQRSSAVTPKPNLELPTVLNKANGGRSTLALERQINELTSTFEEYKNASEARHKFSEGTLTRILDAVNRLDSPGSASRTPTPFLATPSSLIDIKPTFSNPAATPELIALMSKVVSESRSRVGKKKGGADDNSCKEHARNTFYRMLAITTASEIRPFFEDEYGDPDTLPTQFVDPDTKYCRPYPHWKAPLVKQAAWVPTYILRFRSTVPNDQSELSNMLRNLTDEQVLILLNDGPFKSACAAWRNAKKTDAEIEAMRSSARRYQRSDKKAAVRSMYIRAITSLQAPEWEYLWQTGYMSQDESDEEGALVTKRPEHRARWETNLYEAIHVAEREKAKARLGLYPRLPHSRVKAVKRPIPHLERGTGSGKAVIRIALCGISRSWREKYPEELQKSIHLINMKEAVKPDITFFLAKYPMPDTDSIESVKDEPNPDDGASDSELWAFGTQVDGQLGEGGEYGMGFGMGVGDGMVEKHADEEEGLNPRMVHVSQELGAMGIVSEQDPKALAGGSDVGHIGIIIDPLLLREDDSHNENFLDVFSTSHPALGFHMPPPPLLIHNPSTASDEPVDVDKTPIKGKGKATGAETSASTGEVAAGQGPKRRGRPLGSKNKPKS